MCLNEVRTQPETGDKQRQHFPKNKKVGPASLQRGLPRDNGAVERSPECPAYDNMAYAKILLGFL